jgi:SAM-dependent methyltransferase
MKTANDMPLFDARRFMGLVYPVLEAQLIYTALELKLFEHLAMPKTAEEVACAAGCHPRNILLLLNALVSKKYLTKENNKFHNQPDTEYYLNPKSEMYIGDHILYWRDMTELGNLSELVKNGPKAKTYSDDNGSDFFDFRAMGQGARNSMYTGRVQNFISLVKKLFKPDDSLRVLDLGGGSGILSVEIARNFKNAAVTVFDQPFVTVLTRQVIAEYGVSQQVQTRDGNFVTDDFGRGYDLIIASGIIDFVGDLAVMSQRLYEALKDTGFLYVSTHGINEDFTAPAPFILGWLSSHLNGLDILKPDPVIRQALADTGFKQADIEGSHTGYILKKS